MSLFNGKDLAGWTTKQLHNHDWSVVDGVIDCNPQGEGKGDRELWTTKEYADFELWVDWRIKESPYVNKKARIILPDGSYQKDESGNVMTVEAPNTDSGVFLRGQHKSQVNIWCWSVGSGEVWGYRTDAAFDAKVHAGVTPKVKADKAIGDWNTFHITLKCDRLTVTLSYRDTAGTWHTLTPGYAIDRMGDSLSGVRAALFTHGKGSAAFHSFHYRPL